MVECISSLDMAFNSLADPTRRDILQRVSGRELSVNEIASQYKMSLAAVSKHLKIMQQASLIRKRRSGKQQLVSASPTALKEVTMFLQVYEAMWKSRLDNLEKLLEEK